VKKFTCTEEILKVTHEETGAVVIMHKGDSLSLPEGMVEDMCRLGWGKADGVKSGERKEGVQLLHAQNTKAAPKKK
jgi:hypothetical protein